MKRRFGTPLSPARLLALIMAITFAIELALMVVFGLMPQLPVWIQTLLDATVLVILLFPTLYLLVFRPMRLLILQHRDTMEALDLANGHLLEDIRQRQLVETELRLAAQVFEHTLEGIIITDAELNIVSVNDTFTRITGYSREEVLGHNPRFLQSGHQGKEFYHTMWQAIARDGHWSGEIWNRKKDGTLIPELLYISSITDTYGQPVNYVGIFSDITQMKEHQQQLERRAHYDALTDVPNRVLLADRLKQSIAQCLRDKSSLAVCYLDLDGFKAINDTLGHEIGDRVLVEIARRIEASVRGGDTIARLGGDEFVVLLPGLSQVDEYQATVERLLVLIAKPIEIENRPLTISASIGVSICPADGRDPDILLHQADQAMYEAKRSGKNSYRRFDHRTHTGDHLARYPE